MNTIELTDGRSATLLDICMYPGISPLEISSLYAVGSSTIYDDVKFLRSSELIVEVVHGSIHVPPSGRLWPTPLGVEAAAANSNVSMSEFMSTHPVSRQWRSTTVDRIDALASVYRLCTAISELDGCRPMALRLFRTRPYDALIETDDGRTIGIVRQGLMRDDSGLQHRLDEIEWQLDDVCPSALLIMAPCRRTRYLIARGIAENRQALRLEMNVYVGTESADLLTDHESAHWLSTADLHTPIDLKTVVNWAKRGGPFIFPSEDLNDTPTDNRFPFDASTFRLTRDDKLIMEVLADRPVIRREDLITHTGKTPGGLTRHMTRLVRHCGVVEQTGTRGHVRYMLSQEGVDYMARRDRAHVGLARSIWSGKPLKKNEQGGVAPRGHVVKTVRREPGSTDGLYRIVSRLIADVRDHPDYTLEYLLPQHRTHVYVEPKVSIRPDASAGILYRNDTYIQFHLEYEERARYRGGLDEKLEPYRKFFRSKALRHKRPQFLLPVLFVFPDETIEERFVNMAADSKCCLPALSSNIETLEGLGFLGSPWRQVWEPRVFTMKSMSGGEAPRGHPLDSPRMPLTDLSLYRWVATYGRTIFCADKLDELREQNALFAVELGAMDIVALARTDSDHEWRGPEKRQ